MRIVLDTNVLVSALIWGGKPLRLLELAADGTIIIYTSPALMEELADVLGRGHLAERLLATVGPIELALKDYADLAIQVVPKSVPRVVPDDVDDDHVIAAAVASGAEAVVSGDSDLLALGTHGQIAIWTVAFALESIGAT